MSRKARESPIADISLAHAEETAARHGDKAFAVALDVTKTASIEAAVESVGSAMGRGRHSRQQRRRSSTWRRSSRSLRRATTRSSRVNVKGLFFTLQAVAKRMIARGRAARSSTWPRRQRRTGEALVSIYCASKAAVISLTQSAGLDLIKHHINVNGIAPGVVDTPMWDSCRRSVCEIRASPAPARKSGSSAKPFPSDAWGGRTTMSPPLSFWRPPTVTMWVAQTLNVDGGNWMS